jgi:hypothetical protein
MVDFISLGLEQRPYPRETTSFALRFTTWWLTSVAGNPADQRATDRAESLLGLIVGPEGSEAMLTQCRWRRACKLSVAVAVLTILAGGSSSAQTSSNTQQPAPPPASQDDAAAMRGRMMRGMMAERQNMMAEATAMDQKLDELVARMNTAEGPAKVDAIAAVVNELVARRTEMRDRMMTMQDRMMQQMMSMMGGTAKPGSAQEDTAPAKDGQAPDVAPHQH